MIVSGSLIRPSKVNLSCSNPTVVSDNLNRHITQEEI
jgi:hypothetical protein